jgi:hypothetical protein
MTTESSKEKLWDFEGQSFEAVTKEDALNSVNEFLRGPAGMVANPRVATIDEIHEHVRKPVVPPTAEEQQRNLEFHDLLDLDTALTIRFEDLERKEPGVASDTEQEKLQDARRELNTRWDDFKKRWPRRYPS